MSPDNHDRWRPRTPPSDPEAAARLAHWLASGDAQFVAPHLDFRGADLSGGDFTEAWFTESRLTGVSLRQAELCRAHFEAADLIGADLTDAGLVKAVLDDAVLTGAKLDRADLCRTSLCDTDARSASFRGAVFLGTSLLDVDLRGADLSDAKLTDASFHVHLDERTVLTSLSGTAFGPATVTIGDVTRELAGAALEEWLAGRGARVEVLSPRRTTPPRSVYYAIFRDGFSRGNPSGVLRRRIEGSVEYHEAFTRNLRWEPTEFLRLYALGHNEDDYEEITVAEVNAFIVRVAERIRNAPPDR